MALKQTRRKTNFTQAVKSASMAQCDTLAKRKRERGKEKLQTCITDAIIALFSM